MKKQMWNKSLSKLWLLSASMVVLSSCAPIIPGTFTGTITESNSQAMNATLTVAQNGETLSGTLLTSFSTGGFSQNSALFSGRVVGSIFTGGFDIRDATLTGGQQNCTRTGQLRFTDERITGSVVGQGNCAGLITFIDVSRNGTSTPAPSPQP